MTKRVLDATDKVLGRLPKHGLAICLPRVTQNNPQYMGPQSLAVFADDRSSATKVDLGFLTRSDFDAAKGKRFHLIQLGNEPSNAVILGVETVLVNEVLIDPLCRQSLFELIENLLPKRLATACITGVKLNLLPTDSVAKLC